MTSGRTTDDIRLRYQRFAKYEAKGVSATYESFAAAVANDDASLRQLAQLPREKQQPNLLFAVVRHAFGLPSSVHELLDVVHDDFDALADVMLARRVQTNEPGRCAVLLPLLVSLPQPIALVEIGAAAGLCLIPDRYGYEYRSQTNHTTLGNKDLRFPCDVYGVGPLPHRLPEIVWRLGIDLNPIDPRDTAERRWLQNLVWPEHVDRARRLGQALELAALEPPPVVQGDLTVGLPEILSSAPEGVHMVVMHSAVLSYLPNREVVAETIRFLKHYPCTWISNEGSRVIPSLTADMPAPPSRSAFVLARDAQPMALSGPHGQYIEWL